jgi:EmrB/QacA subfamily drug resistance transporter
MMVALDALVVSTALPTLRSSLAASTAQLEWTVNAFVLSLAVLLMTGAAIGDAVGRRRAFVVGVGLFSVASAACALAPSPVWLIAARAIQGAGAAATVSLALVLLSEAYPGQDRAKALGVFAGVTGLGVVIGPLVGGGAVELGSWRWVFWLNVPIGVAVIAFARGSIRESFGPRTAVDLAGLMMAALGVFGLAWGLVRGNTAGWSSGEVLAAIGFGGLLLVAFAGWERRAPAPMLPARLFSSRSFSFGNAAIFFLWASSMGAIFFMAQFLQIALHYTPLGAGVRLMPWAAASFIVAPMAGARVARVGERTLLVSGILLVSGAGLALALLADAAMPYSQVAIPLILAGIGASLALPAAQSAVLGSVTSTDLGKASGAFSTFRQLGGALGIAASVAAFTASGGYDSEISFTNGFSSAMAVTAVLAAAGALAAAGVSPRAKGAPASPVQALSTRVSTPHGKRNG